MRQLRAFGFLLTFALCFSVLGFSQDPAAGLQLFSTNRFGIDLASSNLHLEMAGRQKPGMPVFDYRFVGDFHIYRSAPVGKPGNILLSANLGGQLAKNFWQLQIGYVSPGGLRCDHVYVVDSNGQHWIGDYCTGQTLPYPIVVQDGSGYTATSGGVYDKHGDTSIINLFTDPDGNSIKRSQQGVTTDSLNETALTETFPQPGQPGNWTFQYLDAAGATQEYTLTTSTYNMMTNFACAGTTDAWSLGAVLPSSITTATGDKYSLYYEPTPGYTGYVTGRLAQIVYPSGASISYAYSGGNNGLQCTSYVVPTITVTVNDGHGNLSKWTYVNSNTTGPAANYSVVETDPAGNRTMHYFAGESETQSISYQGTNTVLKTVTTCYNGNLQNCVAPTALLRLPIVQTDVYTAFNSSSSSNHVKTTRDYYGNVTSKLFYDFGATSPTQQQYFFYGQSWNGTSCSAYPSGIYINDTPCRIVTEDSGGNVVAETRITYSNTGHPTSTSKWVAGSSWLTSTAGYNTNGTTAWTSDAGQNQTTFSYTGSGGCNGILPTSTAYPNGTSTSQQWDCNGGVITAMIDENGNQTAYGYKNSTTGKGDPLYRPLTVVDPLNNTTQFTYTSSTIESAMNFGAISTSDILLAFDYWQRPTLSQKRQSQSASTFDTTQTIYKWNSSGLFTTQSVPYSGTAGQAAPTGTALTTTQYDAIGRPLTVTDGGGGTVSYVYSNNDVLQKTSGTQTFQKQLEYDGLGRLTSVCEITSAAGSSSCGQSNSATGFLTKYTNDALGNLLTVQQNAQPGAIGGTQTRSYAYDGLGRMTSESNPETGTVAYTFDTDSTCGTSNGDLVKKADAAGNVTCHAYDGLHRPTGITYPSGPYAANTPPKTLIYDATTFTCPNGSNVKGRLAEAFTGPSTAKITDIAYCYSPRGEITDAFESTPNSGGYYHTTASYWANGATATLGGVPGLSAWAFTPDGEGRALTATWGTSYNWVTGTTYYPTYPQTTVTFGNGDSDVYGYDANTGRMNQFQFTVGATPKTLAGAVGWNPNGTLGTLGVTDPFNASNTQNCSYGYDDLARVSGVNCVNGSTTVWNQSFSPDAFGNLSKSGSSSFAATYLLTNGTTNNREQTVGSCVPTYDANGNLTKDCSFSSPPTYAWDADGNPTNLRGASLTYDALDREVEIASGSAYTQILYSPIGKLGLMNGQTAKTIRVLLPGGSTAELIGATGTTRHTLHSDWLGTARLSTTYVDRTVAYDTGYAPYGENYAGSGGSSSDLDFTGQFQDTMSGLYDFLYREYDPVQGRWISPDPAGMAAVDPSNPQSWNRYAYVLNNPLSHTDPLGLWCYYGTTDDNGNMDLHDPDAADVANFDFFSTRSECEGRNGSNGGTWYPDNFDSVTSYGGSASQVDTIPANNCQPPFACTIPPPQGPPPQGPQNQTPVQKQQQCISKFYNSAAGPRIKVGAEMICNGIDASAYVFWRSESQGIDAGLVQFGVVEDGVNLLRQHLTLTDHRDMIVGDDARHCPNPKPWLGTHSFAARREHDFVNMRFRGVDVAIAHVPRT